MASPRIEIINETTTSLPAPLRQKVEQAIADGTRPWDRITDMCKSAGLWCYLRKVGQRRAARIELVISHPRTYYAAA